jgi:hypothetical protein
MTQMMLGKKKVPADMKLFSMQFSPFFRHYFLLGTNAFLSNLL